MEIPGVSMHFFQHGEGIPTLARLSDLINKGFTTLQMEGKKVNRTTALATRSSQPPTPLNRLENRIEELNTELNEYEELLRCAVSISAEQFELLTKLLGDQLSAEERTDCQTRLDYLNSGNVTNYDFIISVVPHQIKRTKQEILRLMKLLQLRLKREREEHKVTITIVNPRDKISPPRHRPLEEIRSVIRSMSIEYPKRRDGLNYPRVIKRFD
jgi:chromosome segregation ATPase